MKPEDSSLRSAAKPDRYHRFVRWSEEDQRWKNCLYLCENSADSVLATK